jgi:hypothetical protein
MEQTSLSFTKVPLDIVVELAFQLGMAYQDLYTKADLANAINFSDLQYTKGFGAQFKLSGTMEDLPKIFSTKNTEREKSILSEMRKIINNKTNLITICG